MITFLFHFPLHMPFFVQKLFNHHRFVVAGRVGVSMEKKDNKNAFNANQYQFLCKGQILISSKLFISNTQQCLIDFNQKIVPPCDETKALFVLGKKYIANNFLLETF